MAAEFPQESGRATGRSFACSPGRTPLDSIQTRQAESSPAAGSVCSDEVSDFLRETLWTPWFLPFPQPRNTLVTWNDSFCQ